MLCRFGCDRQQDRVINSSFFHRSFDRVYTSIQIIRYTAALRKSSYGTVRNVIDFGVFVDIGVHQDGLVHISRVCDRYIKHPSEVLAVGDVVKVVVLEVDEKRKRISLSIRDVPKEQR